MRTSTFLQVVLARVADHGSPRSPRRPSPRPARRGAAPASPRRRRRARSGRPVWLRAARATSARRARAHDLARRRRRPPGPRSMIQSAARITSRLCSITTTEWPAVEQLAATPAAASAMSSKCSPVVGSSNRNSVPPRPRPARRGARPGARQLQPLRLAAAQRGHRLAEPEVVRAPRPAAARGALEHVARGRRRTRSASATVISSTSAMDGRGGPPSARRRSGPPAPRRGSACRRSPGSAGRRRSGTASRRARSRCRRRSGSGRCRS